MITLYELKTNSFCNCFVKTPYYIKNFFLIGILSVMLAVIYLVYFRIDGLYFGSITKILKGLNSQTFNYLQYNSETLRLTRLLNNYQAQITSNQFMDDCVRINKPCKFEKLAKSWDKVEEWKIKDGDYETLKKKLGDHQVEVYIDMQDSYSKQSPSIDSFKASSKSKMKYSDFLGKLGQQSMTVAMKDSSERIQKALLADITLPQFIDEFNEIDKIELLQGSVFLNPGHYSAQEQMLCAIDGFAQVKLIPHIYRQEVYAGQNRTVIDQDASDDQMQSSFTSEPLPKNYSPVDFFNPDLDNYPVFDDVERKYTVIVHEGDCVYIPAFYFHQYVGKRNQNASKDSKETSLMVSIKFKGNSAILNAFMEAVEQDILT